MTYDRNATVGMTPIPSAVEKECCGPTKTLDVLRIQKALDESRVAVAAVKNRRLVVKLEGDFSLGLGEAEAIALALSEKANLVATDDKNGTNACKLLGVPFTTAIAILVRCREKGLLEAPDAFEQLSLLARHGRYKDSILEDARQKWEAMP